MYSRGVVSRETATASCVQVSRTVQNDVSVTGSVRCLGYRPAAAASLAY